MFARPLVNSTFVGLSTSFSPREQISRVSARFRFSCMAPGPKRKDFIGSRCKDTCTVHSRVGDPTGREVLIPEVPGTGTDSRKLRRAA